MRPEQRKADLGERMMGSVFDVMFQGLWSSRRSCQQTFSGLQERTVSQPHFTGPCSGPLPDAHLHTGPRGPPYPEPILPPTQDSSRSPGSQNSLLRQHRACFQCLFWLPSQVYSPGSRVSLQGARPQTLRDGREAAILGAVDGHGYKDQSECTYGCQPPCSVCWG